MNLVHGFARMQQIANFDCHSTWEMDNKLHLLLGHDMSQTGVYVIFQKWNLPFTTENRVKPIIYM